MFAIQQFDGNFLGPKILGDSTGLSSFWVIFPSRYSAAFSAFWAIAGVPIFAVIYAGVKALTNKKLRKKDLPTETTSYMTVGKLEENDAFTEYVPETRKKHTTRKKQEEVIIEEVADQKII